MTTTTPEGRAAHDPENNHPENTQPESVQPNPLVRLFVKSNTLMQGANGERIMVTVLTPSKPRKEHNHD